MDKFLIVNAEGEIHHIDPVDERIFQDIGNMTYYIKRNRAFCQINFFRKKFLNRPKNFYSMVELIPEIVSEEEKKLILLSWEEYEGYRQRPWLIKDEVEDNIVDMDILGCNEYGKFSFMEFLPGAYFVPNFDEISED